MWTGRSTLQFLFVTSPGDHAVIIRVFRELFSKEEVFLAFDWPVDIVWERFRAGFNNNDHFKVKIHEPYIKVTRAHFNDKGAVLEAKVSGGKHQTRIFGFARMTRLTQCFYTYGFGFLVLFFLFSLLGWLFLEDRIIFPLLAVVMFAFSYVLFKVSRRAYLADVQYLQDTLKKIVEEGDERVKGKERR